MRRFVAFCLLLIMPATLFGQAANGNSAPKTVTLVQGQVLELSLITPLDSDRAHTGDEITFKLEKAIEVDQLIILPRDWPVHAKVTKVTRAGKNCKSGRVRWKLEVVTAPDGRKIKVQDWYRANFRGHVEDRVHIESAGDKIGRDIKEIRIILPLVPVVVLLLPFAIVSASGGRECGRAGSEEHIPAGTRYYSAVSKSVRVEALPSPLP